jgi:hypothetical protein
VRVELQKLWRRGATGWHCQKASIFSTESPQQIELARSGNRSGHDDRKRRKWSCKIAGNRRKIFGKSERARVPRPQSFSARRKPVLSAVPPSILPLRSPRGQRTFAGRQPYSLGEGIIRGKIKIAADEKVPFSPARSTVHQIENTRSAIASEIAEHLDRRVLRELSTESFLHSV